MQTISKYEPYGRRHIDGAGLFISALIQNSYNAGYNHFQLNTQVLKERNYLAYDLKGIPENPLHLVVNGNVGDSFGQYSSYGHFTVKGMTMSFLSRASEHCTFVLEHIFLKELESVRHNTYISQNVATLKTLLADVPPGNRIIQIKDGKEVMRRDFDAV